MSFQKHATMVTNTKPLKRAVLILQYTGLGRGAGGLKSGTLIGLSNSVIILGD